MISNSEIKKIVSGYSDVRIGVMGSHSALEVMDGAKDENFQTVVYCQKGREEPYQRFSRIADEIIVLNKFKDTKSINKPCIVKVQEMKRPLERAFFTVSSYKDYKEKSESKIRQGLISRKDLEKSSIEELAIGTYMNFNFFHTPISKQVDFIGIDRRLQTNVHDFNALPAKQQLDIDIDLQNIEVGHTPASIRESLLEKVIKMGDKFVAAVKKEYAPGIIGPFSLQSVITKDLELVVYDVSLRVPGNPIVATTSPYTKYQYGKTFGVGRRIAMEIRRAQEEDRLDEIVT